jgi:hypothetical protein
VGHQLAQYLRGRPNSFHGADALVVGLDAGGRVELLNETARAALGDDLLGRDWIAATVPERDRAQARVEFARLLCGDGVGMRVLTRNGDVNWRWSLSRDAAGEPVGALGWGERAQAPALAMLSAWRAALA